VDEPVDELGQRTQETADKLRRQAIQHHNRPQLAQELEDLARILEQANADRLAVEALFRGWR
jgi:hypothetical protein